MLGGVYASSVVNNLVVNNGEALTVWLRTSLPGEELDQCQVELRVVGGKPEIFSKGVTSSSFDCWYVPSDE